MRLVLAFVTICVAAIIMASWLHHDRKAVAGLNDPNVVWVPPAPSEIIATDYNHLTKYILGHPIGRPIAKKYMEDGKIDENEKWAIYLETERAEFTAACEKPEFEEPPK